jgi:hypothetical protein
MTDNKTIFKNPKVNLLILLLSILTASIWIIGTHINVYQNAFLGAIFELLWLPTLALFFGLPIAAIYFLYKDKFNIKSFNYLSITILLLAILITLM